MNIILVPSKSGSGKNSCLSHRHLLLILLIGGLLLPLFFGILTFKIQALLEKHASPDDRLTIYAKELAEQSRAIERAKLEAATHLNALARRMGQLQPHTARL